ncbi:MAG: response regulator transcription factor [Lachnospiraceae bacterium]|nr:response regulator transcription factor [Lachnospiraceae bacterium]
MRIAICDDEIIIREDIEKKVRSILPEASIKSYASAGELLSDEDPDILLLDIQMDGMNGMEAAKRLREHSSDTVLIFITAMEEYVYEAFDVGAFHYLIKPFTDEKFKEVLLRAASDIQKRNRKRSGDSTRHIIIQDGISRISIDTADIIFAEVLNRTVTIHLTNRDVSYRGSMVELSNQLGDGFFQTHRSFLVNMKYVTSYSSAGVETPKGMVAIARGNLKHFVKTFMDYIRIEDE